MRAFELIAILFINVIVMLQFSLLAPILPLEIKRRHIPQAFTGLIMASVCVGYLLCPQCITSVFFPRFGRRKSALIGFVIMSSALLLYGLGYFIPDSHKRLYVAYSIITRLIEGIGFASTVTSLASLITQLFPHELGFAQSARFLGAFSGTVLGVVAGACVFELLGYFGVFISFSVVVFLTSFLVFAFEEHQHQANSIQDASLSYWDLLKVRRVSLVMVCGLATDLLLYTLESTLALKLRTSFDFLTSTIGLYFGIFLAATVVVGVAGLFFPEKWEKRNLVMAMLWMNFVAPLLIGPSRLLRLPDSSLTVAMGLVLGGSTRSLMAAYIIAEGVKGGLAEFAEQQERVGDLVASTHMVGQGVTLLVCPIIGSALSEWIGFESTMDLEAVLFLVISVVFTVFTVSDLRKERKEEELASNLLSPNEEEEEEEAPLVH